MNGIRVDAHPLDGTSCRGFHGDMQLHQRAKKPSNRPQSRYSDYDRISTLERFPNLGRPGRKLGTRELVFHGLPYLAVYRVRGGVVEINRILHGAQRWP